ncbi:MAG TPA: glycoside hydrolase family 92 protein, partial [Mariniphaga anaerophila]|nr:glycoside hydrolase family 92 protein [Mariniphaga anaerophila]
QFVDLLIGTAPANTPAAVKRQTTSENYGQTIPAVTAPFGMTQFTPQTHATEKKCVAPYYWGTPALQGFRATHWTSGSCVQDYGSFTVFPTTRGNHFRFLPSQRKTLYVYNSDLSSPAYYAAMLPESNILTEITATRRAGFFRFSWLDPENPTIIIDVNSDEGKGFIKIDAEKGEITGYNPAHRIYNGHGHPAGFNGYFAAQFDKSIVKAGTYGNNELFDDITEQQNKNDIGAYVTFEIKDGEVLKMKIGTSFTSIENARLNMETEIPHWDFEKTKIELEKTWNSLLGRINVEGGSDDDYTKFYTAMYHSLIHPRLFSDTNGDYPEFGGGKSIQKANGFDYYCDFSNWDIFRTQMPLVSIIAPEYYENMVQSLIVKAEQGGWLPIFPMWNSYTSAMIGDHSTSVITDALMKGFDIDAEKAYNYMRKNAFETPVDLDEYIDGKGRRALESYLQFDYIPIEDEVPYAFHTHEQVSRTMEYAYNDWTVAQVAQKLGKSSDYNELMARSLNYANVFDPDKGWVCGRYGDGTFTDEFDANGDMFYITEGTPKQYTWFVPHDIQGLMDLMGGSEPFSQKLNAFIDNKEYWHGNEPSHHIPYLFNYIGNWEKTQETVKNLLQTEYGTGPGGLSGNDDAGQMSAWYVFGAAGFYPVCPGSNEYQLSSPVFEKVTFSLNKKYYPGGKFVLETPSENQYNTFSRVLLNNNETEPVIRHEDLQTGGKLQFLTD